MSKKKNKRTKSKKRHNSSLKQHKRDGKQLIPPFMTIPNTTLTYWLRDDLPDMLWLAMLCTKHKDVGMVMARKVFDMVERVLKEEYGDMDNVPKDIFVNGKLTSFDTLPDKLRPKVVSGLKLLGIYETVFPRTFAVALSRYNTVAPARWLWEYPEPAGGYQESELNTAEDLLKETIETAWSGHNQVSTWAKIATTSALFSAGRIKLTKEIADDWASLLPRYPNNLSEDERKRVESSMRAMYISTTMLSKDSGSATLKWARQFWRANWKLYECETGDTGETMTAGDQKTLLQFTKQLEKHVEQLSQEFYAVASDTDPDLYDPSRHEVLSGIVARMLRAVSAAVYNPHMWSMEHGSGVIRGLIEARIIFAWLVQKGDPNLYDKFKDYGRGHLKLLKLHLEEYQDKQSSPSPELAKLIENLGGLVNMDISEEFQNIRLDANFAGNTNTRKMAEEVGLEDDYRFIFAPASAAAHGEWSAVDQFALEVCTNPLHKGHRLPRRGNGVRLGPQLMEIALDQLDDLVSRYKTAMVQEKK